MKTILISLFILNRMIKKILVGLLVLLTLLTGSLYYFFSPHYPTSLQYKHHHITITRDDYGIPHIQAPSRRSYLYALGNLMA